MGLLKPPIFKKISDIEASLGEKANKTKYYSPEDYGAIGDGVTDDSIAFTNMLNDILSNGDTFNRSVKLKKSYYLSQPITMMDRLKLFNDKTDMSTVQLIFADNLSGCFIEPTTTIVAGKLWNFEMSGISITSNSPIFKGGTLQFWGLRFEKCNFNSKIIFDSMLLYLSIVNDNSFQCASFGKQFTIVDSWIKNNQYYYTETYGTSNGIFIDLVNCTTSRVTNNYFTIGAITSYVGIYTGVKLYGCKTIIFSENVFDCSNGNFFDIGNSSKFISVVNNILRGWGSMANYNSASQYKRNAAIILGSSSHILISLNSFSKFTVYGVFPALTNKADYCLDTYTPEHINICNNVYEDGLIYYTGVDTACAINEPTYTATVFTIPV